MATWRELVDRLRNIPRDEQMEHISVALYALLAEVGKLRGNTNVLLYGTAFLQKPRAPAELNSITLEDVNGLMTTIHGMKWDRPLTLILHTPGGSANGAETIVEYLRTKFDRIEVIVPTFAFSAGTMISLGGDVIVMGRQSQLGPIDPQLMIGPFQISARAVVDQFEAAKADIAGNQKLAHVWAPILQSFGPDLLIKAKNALEYGEGMVRAWLARYMLRDDPDRQARAAKIASHFNDASHHKSHGRRIDRAEAANFGVKIEELEASQPLQEAVLTAYHLMTLGFQRSPAAKAMVASHNASWLRMWSPKPQSPQIP